MKKILIALFIACLIAPITAFAHKPLLMVDDNGDGTIYIETGFSDGSSGSGHIIRLKDAASGKVLAETKVPEEGSLDIKKPSVPYVVVFDAGEGHVVETEGPAPSDDDAGNAAAADEAEETTENAAAPAPSPTAVAAPAPVAQAVAPPVSAGYGAAAAYQAMLVTQVFIAVGIFLIFGIIMFVLGQRTERNRSSR